MYIILANYMTSLEFHNSLNHFLAATHGSIDNRFYFPGLSIGHRSKIRYPWGSAAQKVYASVAVPPAPVRIPSRRPLAPSVTSFTTVS